MWLYHGSSDRLVVFATWGEVLQVGFFHVVLSTTLHRFFVKSVSAATGKKAHKNCHNLQSVTWAEFQILVFLLDLLLVEFQSGLWGRTKSAGDPIEISSYFALIAQSGVLGCLFTIFLIAFVFRGLSLAIKIVLQSLGPLIFVECCLRCTEYKPQTNLIFPHVSPLKSSFCIQWLLEFLSVSENTEIVLPRYMGLVYWILTLAVLALPTILIVHRRQLAVVVVRKWFHFIAVLLFAPITIFSPTLMALAYAVALCGLLILEAIRREISVLNKFYQLLQDPNKDDADGMITSHICLILGCAVPLWLSLAMFDVRVGRQGLLQQWGVLCLGVGDAMAAVFGKTFGQTRWGTNNRTLEGSAAMWISMIAVGRLLGGGQWRLLLEATTLVTVMEAYTTQMDNLILPLAGSIWIVLRLLMT